MKYLAVIAGILFSINAQAQFTRHIIYLHDKAGTIHSLSNPVTYLSPKAIDRRTRHRLSIDSTDLPLSQNYLQQISAIPGITILNQSRWLNALCIKADNNDALQAVTTLPFVHSSVSAAARQATTDPFAPIISNTTGGIAQRQQQTQESLLDYGINPAKEIQLHNGQFLHNLGLQGQNMHIAMLDAGYFRYKTLRAFDSVNLNAQVISTWDFVTGDAEVNEDNAHGMQCFSTIAANIPGVFVGKTPKASFHLFRTEDAATEYLVEEFNWACGAERADSAGADVISSSLGYGYGYSSGLPDLPYSSLDGKTTIAARAANMATRKGMLVFNAAGNAGEIPWKMILTPADADSVIAVGAVNNNGVVGAFSSYGPAADGRIKPDVAAVGAGATIQLTNNNIGLSSGTSYACPNMAGLATCLWQAFPELNNMTIARALKASGNIYNNPDNRIGYGVPDLKKAFGLLVSQYSSVAITITPCEATIQWNSKDAGSMRYDIERRTGNSGSYEKVGELAAKPGATLSQQEYAFKDKLTGMATGNISYRIRQVLDTATSSFSAVYIDTVHSAITQACLLPGNNKILVAPNPVRSTATIAIHTTDAVSNLLILIYDLNGKEAARIQTSKTAGLATHPVNLSRLPAGKYVVQVFVNDKKLDSASLLKL